MSKKTLLFFITTLFLFTNLFYSKNTADEPHFQAPKNIIVISSKFNEHGLVSLTVVDLKSNELVLLCYDYFAHNNYGEKELRAVIRTGVTVDLKLQKTLNIENNKNY